MLVQGFSFKSLMSFNGYGWVDISGKIGDHYRGEELKQDGGGKEADQSKLTS